jgi:hypothetical protein
MISQLKKVALAGVALGALVGLSTAAARADDTAAENRQLKERVKQLESIVAKLAQQQKEMQAQVRGIAKVPPKQLEAKVAKLTEQQKQTAAQLRGIAKSPKMPADGPPIVCKDQPCPPPPPPPPPIFVSFTNGLKVESFNGDFSFKIGGRILVDGGVSSEPFQGVRVATLPFHPVQAATGDANQAGIRQALLQIDGTAFKWWGPRTARPRQMRSADCCSSCRGRKNQLRARP